MVFYNKLPWIVSEPSEKISQTWWSSVGSSLRAISCRGLCLHNLQNKSTVFQEEWLCSLQLRYKDTIFFPQGSV